MQNSSQQTVSSWLYKANARGAGVDICVSELMATMGVHGQGLFQSLQSFLVLLLETMSKSWDDLKYFYSV